MPLFHGSRDFYHVEGMSAWFQRQGETYPVPTDFTPETVRDLDTFFLFLLHTISNHCYLFRPSPFLTLIFFFRIFFFLYCKLSLTVNVSFFDPVYSRRLFAFFSRVRSSYLKCSTTLALFLAWLTFFPVLPFRLLIRMLRWIFMVYQQILPALKQKSSKIMVSRFNW